MTVIIRHSDEWACIKTTIMVLMVYEDSAHLLDSSTEEIRLLVALGRPYATLMLPAVTAFQQIDRGFHG